MQKKIKSVAHKKVAENAKKALLLHVKEGSASTSSPCHQEFNLEMLVRIVSVM